MAVTDVTVIASPARLAPVGSTPCGVHPRPHPMITTSAMPWWSKGRSVGFDFFGLLWARGRRCLVSIRDCTDTFWSADCAWKVDILHSGLIRECPGPGGPRGRSPPSPSVAYTLTDPWDLLNHELNPNRDVKRRSHTACVSTILVRSFNPPNLRSSCAMYPHWLRHHIHHRRRPCNAFRTRRRDAGVIDGLTTITAAAVDAGCWKVLELPFSTC
jgi:hypothetical protein